MRWRGLKKVFTTLKPIFRDRDRSKQHSASTPRITERTRISVLVKAYGEFPEFLRTRFNITLSPREENLRFGDFVKKRGLPPAQVLFMRFQLGARSRVKTLTPQELKQKMNNEPELVILDAREKWEHQWGSLPGSIPLGPETLADVLETWPRHKPIAIYCHYGIRSLDAAVFLADQGFTSVSALEGGVEAWSHSVDASVPIYEGEPCA